MGSKTAFARPEDRAKRAVQHLGGKVRLDLGGKLPAGIALIGDDLLAAVQCLGLSLGVEPDSHKGGVIGRWGRPSFAPAAMSMLEAQGR